MRIRGRLHPLHGLASELAAATKVPAGKGVQGRTGDHLAGIPRRRLPGLLEGLFGVREQTGSPCKHDGFQLAENHQGQLEVAFRAGVQCPDQRRTEVVVISVEASIPQDFFRPS
jgi:hypothetical protein